MPKIVKPPTDQTCITLFASLHGLRTGFSHKLRKRAPEFLGVRAYNLSDWSWGVTGLWSFV